MESLLGTSLEDPRTMAVMSAVQGLLGGRRWVARHLRMVSWPTGAPCKRPSSSKQRKNSASSSSSNMPCSLSRCRTPPHSRRWTSSSLRLHSSPIRGIRGQPPAASLDRPGALGWLDKLHRFDPRQFVSQGRITARRCVCGSVAGKERAKIKEFRACQDGSRADRRPSMKYGQPVQTSPDPIQGWGRAGLRRGQYVRDPITNKLTLLGNKTAHLTPAWVPG